MTAPTITGLTASVTFGENTVNAAPQIIDSDVAVSDAEGNFNGGTLTVSGHLSGDSISIRDQGTGAAQIGFSGGSVTYGGMVIGTATGGGAGAKLVVNFNANATTAAVEALIENLTYANSNNVNPAASRTLKIVLTDGAGEGDFVIQSGADSPFTGIDVGLASTASFGDLDNDGDLDMVSGDYTGGIHTWLNTGTATAPVYTAQAGAANPFNGVNVGGHSYPVLVDLDGDGDLDAVVGEKDGNFNYFKNTGTATAPVFTLQSNGSDPFNGIKPSTYSAPTFGDIDGDGLKDMVMGTKGGALLYYKNTGTASAPAFTQQASAIFNGFDLDDRATPALGDMDGDGDLDLVVGEKDGSLRYLENAGSAAAPNFVERTGAANPLSDIDVGVWSAPTLVDIDGDGDLDVVAGDANGTLTVALNATARVWINVYAENDAPVAQDASRTTGENSVLNSSVPAASDVDGTIASYALVSGVAKGSLTFNANGTFSYNPNDGFEYLNSGASEQVSFTYRAIDNSGAQSAPKTVTITVTGANDSPVAQDSSRSTGENTILYGSVPGASDVDGTIANYSVFSNVSKGSLTFSDDGTYSYNPNGAFENLAAGASEQVSFTYRAMDNSGHSSAPKTVTITVNGVNDAPVAQDASVSTGEDTVLNGSVPAASDVDGTVASYARVSNPAKGSLTFNADGTYSFNPNGAFQSLGNGETEQVSFTYHAIDNSGATSATKTVTITVTGVNAAPVAENSEDETTTENGGIYGGIPTTDADGMIADIVIDSQPAKGSVTIWSNPEDPGYYAYDYQTNGDFESLGYGDSEDVTFTWHAVDNNGVASAVKSATVTVTGVNDDATLGGVATSITTSETAVAIIDADVTVTDPEGNFDEGTLTVSGLLAEDIVSVNDQGTGAGQIGFTGGIVTFGGVAIGTATGGAGADLVITFNENATTAAVEALTENLTYANGSDAPTASRTLTITLADEIQAKTLILDALTGADNPFAGIRHGDWNATAFGDLDGDGDLDLVAGGTPGALYFYENTGTASSPSFSELTGAANPFAGIDVGGYSSPALVDLDGDGDLDLVAGAQDGTISYFENTGSASTPAFTARTGAANPFDGVDVAGRSIPAFADIDGDGDLDMVAGGAPSSNVGNLRYFENTGSAATPAFTARTGDANPFGEILVGGIPAPSLGDFDRDGDVDLLVGTEFYGIKLYANLGSSGSPVYAEMIETANPFVGIVGGPLGPAAGSEIGGARFTPTFADLDGDGDLDVVAGGSKGGGFIGYVENTGIGKGSSATVTVNVTGVNDAPVAADDARSTDENTIVSGAVATSDVDGAVVSHALVSGVAKGSLTFLEDGSWSFDPDGAFDALSDGESEQVSFAYRATDNNGAQSAVKTVTITVHGVSESTGGGTANRAPSITSAGAYTVAENATAVGKVTASDADGQTPVFAIAGGADASLFRIDARTGALSFKSAPDFEAAADANHDNAYQLLVRASDGAATDTHAVTVKVGNVGGVTIKGGRKKDTVSTDKTVKGQSMATGEEDTITGKGKNDKLHGLGGNDHIDGGKGKDKLWGDAGGDRLTGGKSNDKLYGGAGADSFVFNAKLKGNVDMVKDFEAGIDTFVLDDKAFKTLSPGPLAVEEFVVGRKAKDGDDHIIYNKKGGLILYDQDGKGGKDAVLFAKVGKGLDIDAGDFLVT